MNTRVELSRSITWVTLRPVLVFILLAGILLWQFPERQLSPLSVMILIVGTMLLAAAFEGFIDYLVLLKSKSDAYIPGSGNKRVVFHLVLAVVTLLYLFLR